MKKPGEVAAAMDGLGEAAKPKGKPELHEVRVRRAEGGYIAQHEYKHADGASAHGHPEHGKEHVLAGEEALHAHMKEHFPVKAKD